MTDKELQNNLAEILGGISDGVIQAKDFAVDQLPDVAQQYIMFGMAWETGSFLVYLIGCAVFAMVIRFCLKWLKEINNDHRWRDDFVPSMIIVLSGVAFFISLMFAVFTLKYVFMVWFAPKIYLLQGIAGLLK